MATLHDGSCGDTRGTKSKSPLAKILYEEREREWERRMRAYEEEFFIESYTEQG